MPTKLTDSTVLFRLSPPRAKSLLIVNKGPGAVSIARDADRWDLLEIYFANDDVAAVEGEPSRYDADHIVFEKSRRRRKFEIVQTVFSKIDFWKSYDCVMLADDDLVPVDCRIADMFELFATTGCRVGQPSLTQDSYYSHMLTIKNNNYVWRRTNFAEVMCTMMTREALDEYLPVFNATSSGLFLDHFWSYNEWMRGTGCAILDDTPMRHCRPVFGGIAYQGLDRHETYDRFAGDRGIPTYPQSCLGGLQKGPPSAEAVKLGVVLSGYDAKFIRDTKYLTYAIDEVGVALNSRNLPSGAAVSQEAAAEAHRAAIGMFMATRNVGPLVEIYSLHKSPQGIVDTYWDSTSWQALRHLRAVVNKLLGKPPEQRPIVHDLGKATEIVNTIVKSTSWEMMGPIRACMHFWRGLRRN